jgi:hypothetical protein
MSANPPAAGTRRPTRSRLPLRAAAIVLIGAPATLGAQGPPAQVVRGPVATYWVSADTRAGMGAMAGAGLGGMLGMLAGRAPEAVRSLELRLGSSQAASGPPQAAHQVPPGLGMGASLPLVSPEPVAATPSEPGERTLPQGMEQPKGRMLIFWGCGEKVGPGQPVVIDFSKIGPGQPMPALVSREVRAPRGPAFDRSTTYGAWPNERDRQPVPAQGSLRGEHAVRGNYAPEIRFAVDRHDFMAPAALTATRGATGSQQLAWKAIDGATGYFLSAVGAGAGSGGGTDVVMWTSSAVQEMGAALNGYVPPAEVARLVRERVVLAPDRTDCQVPADVSAAMPAGMLNFVAYGDELDVVFPPRPADPKLPWDQQYAVKLRLKSTSITPLGDGLAGLMGGGGRGAPPAGAGSPAAGGAAAPAPAVEAPTADTAGAPAPSPSSQPAPSVGGVPTEAVEQGVRVLRGLLGR